MKAFAQHPISYDPKWPEQYQAAAEQLRQVFGSDVELHHIGSTAVPGLMAKPIIDVLAEATNMKDIDSPALVQLGYEDKGELGIADRAYFPRSEGIAVHLHIFPKGHSQIEKHLVFRDYLLASPEAVHAYAETKKQLLKQFPESRQSYQDGKNETLIKLNEMARHWRASKS